MILAALIIGCVIGVLGAVFWDDILAFLKRSIEKVRQIVKGVVEGAQILIRKVREGFQEISKNYSYQNGKWEETTITRTVPASEVPEEIRARVGYSTDLDITDEMQLKLENAS